jgi:hypothetical protein
MRTTRSALIAATAALLILFGPAASGGLYSDTVLADNPVGYWRFGEAAGAPQAQDLASGNRPLTYNGFAAANYGYPGAIEDDPNTAVRLTASATTISRPDPNDFGFAAGQSFSLEYWIRVAPGNASSDDAGVVDKGYDGTQDRPWYLSRYIKSRNSGNGAVDLFLRNSAGTSRVVYSTAAIPISDDTWHHVVGIYDSSNAEARLYVDGIYQGSATGVPVDAYGTNSRPFIVGNHLNRFFDGQIDELALYDVALDNLDGVGGVDPYYNRVEVHYLAASGFALVPDVLFNTGVDDTGTPLPNSPASIDPHYTIISAPGGLGPDAFLEDETVFPISTGQWAANSPISKWIAPAFNTVASPGGEYRYETLFDMTDWVPGTAFITGSWATDNPGLDILINGASTGITSGGFGSLTPFTIDSGFVEGVNSLVFVVNNASQGYTGLRVQGLALYAERVPEPASLTLLAIGGLGLMRRRRRTR